MKTIKKIVKHFLNDNAPLTIREIASKIDADYRITYLAVRRMLKEGIITSKKVGSSELCSFNDDYYGLEIYEAEEERKKELFADKDVKQLYREIMTKVKSSLFILLVFGSYAKKKHTKNSDIDLMFISNDEKFEAKVSDVLSVLPLKTHLLVFGEKEFLAMKDDKKPNVVHEAMKNKVILYGIENYYKLKND